MKRKRVFAAIILAAGKGTRMGGDMPKVLHELKGKPMLHHVIETAIKAECDDIVIVVGYKAEEVRASITDSDRISFALQEEQLGTGHAVRCALPYIKDEITDILILFGDVPLIKHSTLLSLISLHMKDNNDITILTSILDDPKGYGRIVLCKNGKFVKIVEDKDADLEEKLINEVNTGICCVSRAFLEDAVVRIGRNNAQNEFYFTDIIEIGSSERKAIGRCLSGNHVETLGVNTVEQLKDLEASLLNS